MADKLQELTDKLYNEGLSKGKQEGERILADAKQKANSIIEEAKAEAQAILQQAQKEAEDLRTKVGSDIRMASDQCLQATRKDIENILLKETTSDKVKASLAEPEFLKSIITAVAGKFSATEASDLALVLPQNLKDELEPWVASELAKSLQKGVKADFSKKMAGGFTIGPKDGSWFVSLTDETFAALIAEYMRPVTRKLLFG